VGGVVCADRAGVSEGGPGRPPVGVERMLRMYFLQQWFNLSDPAVEEALYESVSLRGFVDIDLGREPVPDETTVCKFRHLLEQHQLGARIFERVQEHLQERGLRIGTERSWMRRLCTLRVRPRTRARSAIRNAPDAQGEAVVLRDEGACGRG